jgi:diguanylate cyclase (GGDEF)-like protein/PAS domain S-box-containing protein
LQKSYRILVAAISTALFFGLVDGVIGYYFFYKDEVNFLDILFFDIPPEALYHRIVLFVALLFVGALAARTIQKDEQLKIQEQQHRLQSLTLASEAVRKKVDEIIPITRTDKRGVITFANEAYAKLSGYSIEELIGQKHTMMRHPSTPSGFYKTLWQTIARGDVWEGEFRNIQKNGEEFYIHTHIMPEYDDQGKRIGYIAIRSNVTDVKTLEKIASEDALTGVLNRREFDARIIRHVEEAKRYGKPLSLIYTDIDHFKNINDTFGHAVGDEVLKRFADIIANRLRSSDSFARIGGEEFAILLPQTTKEEALKLAEQLREAIAASLFDRVGSVTASFGVVQLLCSDMSDSFSRRADEALYASKSTGRNRVSGT